MVGQHQQCRDALRASISGIRFNCCASWRLLPCQAPRRGNRFLAISSQKKRDEGFGVQAGKSIQTRWPLPGRWRHASPAAFSMRPMRCTWLPAGYGHSTVSPSAKRFLTAISIRPRVASKATASPTYWLSVRFGVAAQVVLVIGVVVALVETVGVTAVGQVLQFAEQAASKGRPATASSMAWR